jgi:outer membrane protein assembly factor BamB
MKTLRIFLLVIAALAALFVTGCCYRQPYGPSFNEEMKADEGKNWYFGFNAQMKAIVSTPLLLNDRIYITSIGGYLYCVDKEKGKPIETFSFNNGRPLRAGFRSGPITDGSVLYAGCCDHNLYAIDPASGMLHWAYATNGQIEGAPVLMEGKIYVGNWAGRLYCIDKAIGNELWYWNAKSKIRCTPTAYDGKVYFGDDAGNFYCLDAKSQPELLWEFKAGKEIYSTPATDGDAVWLTSLDGNIYCLDATTGKQRWVFKTSNEIWAGPYIDSVVIGHRVEPVTDTESVTETEEETGDTENDEVVEGDEAEALIETGTISKVPIMQKRLYVGSMDAHFYILNADTGEQATYIDEETGEERTIQPYECGEGLDYDHGVRGPATTDEKYVYFGAGDFAFRALDKVTGKAIWAAGIVGEVRGKPVVYEGKVVFGCDDTYFYGLDTESGHPIKGAL